MPPDPAYYLVMTPVAFVVGAVAGWLAWGACHIMWLVSRTITRR